VDDSVAILKPLFQPGHFMALLLMLSLYYLGAVLYLYRGLRSLHPSGDPAKLTYSIVIAARNEEESIRKCLDAVCAQTLASNRFEVIVVDDRSIDATGRICVEYALRCSALSVITVAQTPAGIAPKKHAVGLGIQAAKNEVVVQTDADCIVPPTWLETIDRNFAADTGLVQGITAYSKTPDMKKWFFGLQAVDFLSHGVVAAAAIGAGMPINSNANNFAFRKKAFEEAGGYGGEVERIVSGDDDLLLQRIAKSRRWKVRFMADGKAAVETLPTKTATGVFEQRKRWGSKTVHYTISQILFLSGIFLFYCGMPVSLCLGFFKPVYVAAFAGMLLIKILGELLLMIPGTEMFNQKKLRPFIVPASIIQLPLVLAAVAMGVFGKFLWKGEKFSRSVR